MGRLNAVRRRFAAILADHDTEPAEMAGASLKVAIGAWLLLPWETFDSSPTFSAMAVLPEWAWGASLLVIGTLHWLALADGDTARRRRAALVGTLIWCSLSITFVATNPPAIGWIPLGLAAVCQGWAYLRLTRLERLAP